jgi:hypothetical protein
MATLATNAHQKRLKGLCSKLTPPVFCCLSAKSVSPLTFSFGTLVSPTHPPRRKTKNKIDDTNVCEARVLAEYGATQRKKNIRREVSGVDSTTNLAFLFCWLKRMEWGFNHRRFTILYRFTTEFTAFKQLTDTA